VYGKRGKNMVEKKTKLHGSKIRHEISLTARTSNILEAVCKARDISKCQLIEALIIQKLADPIAEKKEEMRTIMIRYNELQEWIKDHETKK
jgi:hypothetical protein